MKPELLHILQHSLGVDKYGQGRQYRNHFVTGPGTINWPYCQELVALGLMTRRGGNELTGGDDCFYVTDAGKLAMAEASPKPPKLTRGQRRYRAFLRADCGMSFLEWLNCHGKEIA